MSLKRSNTNILPGLEKVQQSVLIGVITKHCMINKRRTKWNANIDEDVDEFESIYLILCHCPRLKIRPKCLWKQLISELEIYRVVPSKISKTSSQDWLD